MIKVKISTPFPEWPLFRQTPESKGIWKNCEFFIDNDIKQYDYWFILDDLLNKETAVCPEGNIILITGEPESVKQYNKYYLKQFSKVITCQKNIKHKNLIFYQQCLPWMVGWKVKNNLNVSFSKDYDELKSIKTYHKDKLISVISSNKVFTEGHKKRLDFVMKLKDYYGDKIDVFGRGICDIEDKWDALYRYKYHIVIENNAIDDYWTEKLADVYLAGTFPLYYGCTNIDRYFSKNSFQFIDINNVDKSIETINRCINEGIYEKSIKQLEFAKSLVLDKYNLFAFINEFANNNFISSKRYEAVTIKPQNNYYKFSLLVSRIKNVFGCDFM